MLCKEGWPRKLIGEAVGLSEHSVVALFTGKKWKYLDRAKLDAVYEKGLK